MAEHTDEVGLAMYCSQPVYRQPPFLCRKLWACALI
jgi:hypothetical protein